MKDSIIPAVVAAAVVAVVVFHLGKLLFPESDDTTRHYISLAIGAIVGFMVMKRR